MGASGVWFILFFLFIIFGMPILVAMGFGVFLSLLITGVLPHSLISRVFFGGLVESYMLIAVPFFMMTGYIMMIGGIARRIFSFANSLVGAVSGGMGAVNVIASMIFGGMSGVSVADTTGLGPIEIDAMERYEYPTSYAAAITVSSSTLSVIIPPSILLVMYGVVAQVSVGAMLIAGLLPGLFITAVLIAVNSFLCKRRNIGIKAEPFNIKSVVIEFKKSFWALLVPVTLLGGIVSGSVTPTEASVAAALLAFFIAFFIYKEITLADLPEILIKTGKIGSIALIIVGLASTASFILTAERVPDRIAMFITESGFPPLVVMGLLIGFMVIVGMFINPTVSVIVLTPILLPVAEGVGIAPIHFGLIMISTLAIGLITPPVGSCLFAISAVSGLPIEVITKELLPFYLALLFAVLIIVLFPQLTLWLPGLIFS